MSEPQDWRELLDAFCALPVSRQEAPTFFEITGYPHYENVCSNLLEFFLDPNAAHGFGLLLLEALLGGEGSQLSSVSVKRECTTRSGKRLDLVVDSDTHVIAIENKIFSSVDNPLEDYAAFLVQLAGGRIVKKFLLTLTVLPNTMLEGFQPISYSEFFGRVRSVIGRYLGTADARYAILLVDFINTMERLQFGSSAMRQEQLKFFAEREKGVASLLSEVQGFRAELRSKVKSLTALISVERLKNVSQRTYREDFELYETLVHEIQLGDDRVVVDTMIAAKGWETTIFLRREPKVSFALKRMLDRLGIQYIDGEKLVDPVRFSYDESLSQLQAHVEGIVTKIAESGLS